MRDDDRSHPDPGMDTSTDRPATARTRSRLASMGMLALLMAGTSWVVASWVSAWLVPPYLILMALILLPPAGRPQGDPAGVDEDSSDALEPARPVGGPDDPSSPEAPPALAEVPEGTDEAAAKTSTRGRRGKAKARKTKAIVEPSEAIWIEVAPGKFVRSEAARPSAEAGPHDFTGVPAEVPATPQPRDHAEAPEPEEASTDVESAPEGGNASGATEAWGPDEGSETPGMVEGLTAADGNAPQAGGSFDDPEADRPEPGPEALDDRAWVEAEGEGSEPVDESAPDDLAPGLPPISEGSTDLEGEPTAWAATPGPEFLEEVENPDGWAVGEGAEASEADESGRLEDPELPAEPALTDVALESADESMVSDGGDDPTETAVDETVLDDAGPSEGAFDDSSLLPAEATPDAGSIRWPHRLSPRARTRDGHDARATSNAPPPRRPARSTGPARRPPDPRRLTRRGAGRPRQITRAFPPRSPPQEGTGRGRSIRFRIG